MKKKVVLFLICLFCSLSLNAEQPKQELSDELVVGIFPRRDPAVTAKLFTPLIKYLESTLRIPVKLETAKDFSIFIQRLNTRRYDVVHFNQYHYIQANKDKDYDVIVQNEEFGEKTIRGAIYVRSDSGIKSVGQLKGKTILFGGGKTAMMSYIVPSFLLQKAGLNPGDYKETYAISPPNAVLATYLKQADAGGAGEIVYRLPMIKNKIDVSKLKVIAESEPLPHLPWAVKREMKEEIKEKLRSILMSLKTTKEGQNILKQARLSGFNSASDSDYDAHRYIINQVINE